MRSVRNQGGVGLRGTWGVAGSPRCRRRGRRSTAGRPRWARFSWLRSSMPGGCAVGMWATPPSRASGAIGEPVP